MEFEHGDVVLCTVQKISGTTVFVKIEGTEKQGSIILSEIAPGRIRNLRDYVVPKKTICCKILRFASDHIELSLRRVNQKEKKEVMAQHKIERSYTSVLKTILKEKTPEIIEKIKSEETIYNFLEAAKKDPKELQKLTGKEDSEKILEILNSQKTKNVVVKKEIKLTTTEPNGLTLIKKILEKRKDVEIKYLAAGKYSLKKEGENMKDTDSKLKEIISQIETEAKKNGIEFFQK